MQLSVSSALDHVTHCHHYYMSISDIVVMLTMETICQSGINIVILNLRYVSTPGRPVRTQRKERSISDPGPTPLRVPDSATMDIKEEEEMVDPEVREMVGRPQHVIVHHSSARGATTRHYSGGGAGAGYSGGYCEDSGYREAELQSPPSRDFERLMSLDTGQLVIKEEEAPTEEQDTIQQLLGAGARDRLEELGCLMQVRIITESFY